MSKTPQNMAELLNSLLSPINILVVRGNNWQPRMTNDESSMFWSCSSPAMNKTPQKMPKTSDFLFWLAAIFNISRWLPYRRSNMAANAPCHLYCNLKIFEISKFFDVWFFPHLHMIAKKKIAITQIRTFLAINTAYYFQRTSKETFLKSTKVICSFVSNVNVSIVTSNFILGWKHWLLIRIHIPSQKAVVYLRDRCIYFWWLVKLPMWLTDGFSVNFFGRWRGLCANTWVTYSYRTW